ncbi:hypothetical protein L2U69_04880 [Zavarzinia compransoris]|uniref:hypothetical protein n=1 Tax=Zavarzinia marina TaxID=2911065 RepID=UPI001F407DDF|nr:hypothetical protein [Zavarzinia marina]MCF4164971.1 hypothetical protein [Zavarzinia marina]
MTGSKRIARLFLFLAIAAPVVAPGTAAAELPPLETRDIETRPAPKKPKDMLLPGEVLHRRWADPDHPQAPARAAALPPAAAKPRARDATILPPPLTALPAAAALPRAEPLVPVRPVTAAPRRAGAPPQIRLGGRECAGDYFLDGVAVDAMGRPCGGF